MGITGYGAAVVAVLPFFLGLEVSHLEEYDRKKFEIEQGLLGFHTPKIYDFIVGIYSTSIYIAAIKIILKGIFSILVLCLTNIKT